MIRSYFLAVVTAGASLFGATAAHAGTHWAVGINLPVPGLVVSNGGYYEYAPAPVSYVPVPAPRLVEPPAYYEAPRVYAPPRLVYSQPEFVYQGSYRGWERHREYERARWEHERREHRTDDGDGRRWHRD
jgi:hypothetical protein